jgi:hypothetical protein
MTDETGNREATTRQAIEHCRRDIAVAWTQLEAAKDLLRRSRPLLDQWVAEKAQIDSADKPPADDRPVFRVAGRLVTAPPEPERRRRRTSHAYGHRLRRHAQRLRKASA